MEKISTLSHLYTELLRDIYNAEVLEVSELITFKSQIQSAKLKGLISTQISNSRAHIQRLEDMIDHLQQSLLEDHCRTMRSLITETKTLVSKCTEQTVKDLSIIHSLQKITQCKVLVYKTLHTMATQLSIANNIALLEKSLDEEEATFEALNKLMHLLLNLKPAEP